MRISSFATKSCVSVFDKELCVVVDISGDHDVVPLVGASSCAWQWMSQIERSCW